MVGQTVGIVGMGDMGSAVAASFVRRGYSVVTCLEGRSALSRRLASEAGARDLESLDEVFGQADLFLSILPPAAAYDFAADAARRISACERPLIYADCNAIAPATVETISLFFRSGPASFVDVGIIGPAPRAKTRSPTRFYVAGPARGALLDLDVPELRFVDMGDPIGRASAIKMCYGALNKGTDALWTAVLMAAERLGVRRELMQDFEESQAPFAKRMQARLPFHAATAERFTGEMREIAAAFEAVGVTGDFHRGAEWLFDRLAHSALAGESRATLPTERSLDEAITAFVAVLGDRAESSGN